MSVSNDDKPLVSGDSSSSSNIFYKADKRSTAGCREEGMEKVKLRNNEDAANKNVDEDEDDELTLEK